MDCLQSKTLYLRFRIFCHFFEVMWTLQMSRIVSSQCLHIQNSKFQLMSLFMFFFSFQELLNYFYLHNIRINTKFSIIFDWRIKIIKKKKIVLSIELFLDFFLYSKFSGENPVIMDIIRKKYLFFFRKPFAKSGEKTSKNYSMKNL